MGITVSLITDFYCTTWPPSAITDTHYALQQAGLESAPEKSPETVEYENPDISTSDTAYCSLAEFSDMMESADEAAIRYQYDSQKFKLSFHSESAADDQLWRVGLLGPDGRWFSPDANGETTVERRLDTISDAFVEMSIALDPVFGYLMLFNDHSRFEAVPKSHIPTDHGLEALPFLLLLSDPWIEYCGGRSHVLETPAYEIQTLKTGSIVLRIQEQISVEGCHYITGFDHLFGQYDVLNAAEAGDLLHFWSIERDGTLTTGNVLLRVEEIKDPFGNGGGHMRCENAEDTMHDVMMDVKEMENVEHDRVAIEQDGETRHTAGHVYNQSEN